MDQLAHKIEEIFQQQNDMALAAMLKPIAAEAPAGSNLSDDEVYQQIQAARLEDDSTTPRGVWEFDMQRADWGTVYELTSQTLQQRSKDIQLAVWMMEAQLMRTGFSSIAPSIHLLHEMLSQFWEQVHPQMEEGDSEHRVNIISWINSKLAVVVKQIPITARPDAESQYSWSDWEMALRNTQMFTAHPEATELKNEINVDTVVFHINQTAIEFYQRLYEDLELALQAIDNLVGFMDEKLGQDSPTLGGISSLLEEIAGMAYHQLDQRGVLPATEGECDQGDEIMLPQAQGVSGLLETDRVRSRNDAYNALRNIADYLVVDDPHSPAPYLIYKAIEWGRMNTGQLYNELFIERQGQLNIFEMLGVEGVEQGTPSA
ncbi:MAG: type VI secretion system protein TssA [Pseudomonadota bacterium]